MENRIELLDIALKYLEAKKKASFNDIWKHVKNELKIPKEFEEKAVGNLYTGMVLDTHFFLKNDKLWYPRSEVTLDEIKTQVTSIQEAIEDRDSGIDGDDIDNVTGALDNDDSIAILEDKYGDGDTEDDDTMGIDNALNKFKLKEQFDE